MQATHLSESHVSAVIMQNIESDDTALPIQTLERWIMIKPHDVTSIRILEHLQRLKQVLGEFEAMPRYSAHRFARHQFFDRVISAEQWNYREIWNGSVFQSVVKRIHKRLCIWFISEFIDRICKWRKTIKTGLDLRPIRWLNMVS